MVSLLIIFPVPPDYKASIFICKTTSAEHTAKLMLLSGANDGSQKQNLIQNMADSFTFHAMIKSWICCATDLWFVQNTDI